MIGAKGLGFSALSKDTFTFVQEEPVVKPAVIDPAVHGLLYQPNQSSLIFLIRYT